MSSAVNKPLKFLIFDTETTGLPRDYNAPVTDSDNWPRLVQLAWQVHDEDGRFIAAHNYIVKPTDFSIPFNSEKVHGISTKLAMEVGFPLEEVLAKFESDLLQATHVAGHNIGFDLNIVDAEAHRLGRGSYFNALRICDTKTDLIAQFTALPGGKGGKFKWPTLTELYTKLFANGFAEAHNAAADVEATARVFLELIRIGIIGPAQLGLTSEQVRRFQQANLEPFELAGVQVESNKELSARLESERKKTTVSSRQTVVNARSNFAHLRNHSQFSLLQSTTEIKALIERAADLGMPGVGLCDHGNMMGAFNFMKSIADHNKAEKGKAQTDEGYEARLLKPILGCELNVCRNRMDKTTKDNGYSIPFFAKNKAGYHNLAKLSSAGFLEGFYYVPRIDKELLLQHKEHLLVTTGGLWGEVPDLILNVGEEQAEEAFLWWKNAFGENFYAEINRHGLPEEDHVNKVLLSFCARHNVPYFASNNTYYLNKEDETAHDILLCVKDGEKRSTPVGRGRGFRFGFANSNYYFKTPEEMGDLFRDLPEALVAPAKILEQCEFYELAQPVLLPKFDIPEEFVHEQDALDGGKRGENAYLRHLTYKGAEKRYGTLTDSIRERLDFELATIERTGYPGYFLIVQDFCAKAREMGVSVGPGRGSAAGSAVAYCTGITNLDPIQYDLLFERFLNPERVSLPDIDIDFDDEGRQKVIDYVIEKYGSSQVAQIITYGKMAAKSAVRDTGRVLELSLADTDRLAKMLPDNFSLKKLLNSSEKEIREKLNSDQVQNALAIRELLGSTSAEGEIVKQAAVVEGSLRNTGIHACGVIITPTDIRELIPVATAKDSSMWCTQFDNAVVESAGLLKMDFLGLKTLTLIKDACAIVKERSGVELDPDSFPLDDKATYELFQRGETIGIFQYESPGMQKYLKELKPNVFNDLIAMNALYRPGPMEYIPSFVRRKHGLEPITYDLEASSEYLEETYGITVYQEQVMLLSQKLAGFTKGEADVLRKAMGKKQKAVLDTMLPKFIEGGMANGHPEDKLKKIWKDWEAFASYAFNKSHSTCYAWVAYQTAYLKANYPAEYMASVLSNNMSNIKDITMFMEECLRMGIQVLGPDVNESSFKFTVNAEGNIRFGLGAIKGVGENAVKTIIENRKKNGPYLTVYNFVERIDLRAANKKAMENLVLAGAFDGFAAFHRAHYFADSPGGGTFLEQLLRYGAVMQESKNAPPNLFGETEQIEVQQPVPAPVEPWHPLDLLSKEREVIGLYISSHPLDQFKLEINHFCNINVAELDQLNQPTRSDRKLAGMVKAVEHRTTKSGKPFGTFELEDYTGTKRFFLFSEDYLKFKHFLMPGIFLMVTGRMQPRPHARDQVDLEFKITQLQELSEVRANMAKSLVVRLNLEDLNEELLEKLYSLIPPKPDPAIPRVKLVFEVFDRSANGQASLVMPSRSLKIDLSNDTIDQLDKLQTLKYVLK